MTDEELEEIEDLAESAAPGPWWATSEVIGVFGETRWGIRCRNVTGLVELMRSGAGRPYGPREFEFVAQARTAVPKLVAEIRRLRSEFGHCFHCNAGWDAVDPHTKNCPLRKRNSEAP